MTKPTQKNNTRRLLPALIAAILVVVVVLVIWRRGAGPETETPMATPAGVPVEVVPVRTMTLDETVRGVGTLRASASVNLSSEIPGRVRSIDFEEGREVEEGQVLFQLDDERLRSQLEARQAALRAAQVRANNAERIFRRQEQLAGRGVVPEDDFDRARAEMESAVADVDRFAAELALMEEQLRDATIRAPFSGMISARQVDRGAFVGVGDVLARLYQVKPLEIVFTVPERYAGRVQRGQPVAVTVAAFPGDTFLGEVDYVSPALDEATRTLQVKAVVPNQDQRLSPGAFASAVVTLERHENQPVAPEEALVATRQGYMVFVIEDGVAHGRQIRTGLRRNGMVEIVEGLAPGEQVVRSGHLRLSDGSRVEIVGGNAATGEDRLARTAE